jgi:hypothetical protein
VWVIAASWLSWQLSGTGEGGVRRVELTRCGKDPRTAVGQRPGDEECTHLTPELLGGLTLPSWLAASWKAGRLEKLPRLARLMKCSG